MSSRNPLFSGVIPPLLTPLTDDGDVDAASLERLVGFLIDAGVNGVFALGSSGETVYLTDRQRDRVLDVALATTGGQVPVLAGCVDTATSRVVERARLAAAKGVDAVVTTAPFYALVSDREIEAHYRQVHAAVDLPLLAYDVPLCVPNALSHERLIALAREGVLAGIKDSSGNDVRARQRMLALSDHATFSHLTGHEVVVDAMLIAGMDGVVPGLGNVDPHGYVRLYDAAEAGRWDDAHVEQDRLARLFGIVDVADRAVAGHNSAGVGAFKAALVARGIIASHRMSAPLHTLDDDECRRIAALLGLAGLL